MNERTSSCIHELPVGQCGFCKELPFGINKVGFKTKHGHAFHNWNPCVNLEVGQNFAVSRGGEATEIINVTWSSSLQNLQPCEWCCALYYSGEESLDECHVYVDKEKRKAKIVTSRYVNRNEREYQIYFPESGEIWFAPGSQIEKI